MTEPQLAPVIPQPPDGITPETFQIDDVSFEPFAAFRMERALRNGRHIGDVLMDLVPADDDPSKEQRRWFARKVNTVGELGEWQRMRCVHEARAFIVSRIRQ